MRTFTILLISSILLFCLPRAVTDPADVKASIDNPVHNLDTNFNYTSIQDAINANETLTGHTIFAENGTYFEHISVNKSISLIGESRQGTVVDASHVGRVFDVTSENVSISNFRVQNAGNTSLADCAVVANKSALCTVSNLTIQNCYSGILILESNGSSVSGTVILGTLFGMYIHNSSNSVVVKNDLTGCAGGGISIQVSTNCFVRDNHMTNCYTAFAAGGDLLEHFLNDIDTSNTIDGKPIYYLMNQTDITINPSTFPEIGSLTIVNSTRVTIENLTFNKGGPYLFFAFSSNSTIRSVTASNSTSGIGLISVTDTVVAENNVSDCFFSIYLTQSHNNTVISNTISNSGLAAIALRYSTENLIFANNATSDERCIDLVDSENNTIYHNNFVNYSEMYTDGQPNVWDNGLEGNYWSSYAGV
ncbi:right-handed parallel beta-helix repeat-containing protein, partial [Candidatus Bathyarchaeota archaeon]|nr:right-handed parallel beta-helix repeat-containing protein [Candidatus Bathyarchaeota archaeon]